MSSVTFLPSKGRSLAIGCPKSGLVHPSVHLFDPTCSYGVDRLDEPTHLSWSNATEAHPVDQHDRTLKVATRVRIPLGQVKGNKWPDEVQTS